MLCNGHNPAGSVGTFFCYCLIDNQKNKAYIIIFINSGTAEAQQGLFKFFAQLYKAY